MSGTLDGSAFTASSLTLDDWTANDNALAETYITAAATAISANLTTAELALATGVFLTDAYKRVSDPNIGYVDLENDVVKIGLQGFDDATPLLEQLFPIFTGSLPGGLQVSEVVKVTLDGNTQYLYGFSATPTERATVDGSYSGNYEVAFAAAAAAVPTPATLALVAIGLLGLYSRKTLNKINS